MDATKKSLLIDYLVISGDVFTPAYDKACAVNAHLVKTFLIRVIKDQVYAWVVSANIFSEGPLADATTEIERLTLKMAHDSLDAPHFGNIWQETLVALADVFKGDTTPAMDAYLEELTFIQASTVLQLLMFSKSPEHPEILL